MSALCLVWCECMVLLGVNICNRAPGYVRLGIIVHESSYLCFVYISHSLRIFVF